MQGNRGPVIVLCAARSGSTLMRFILDTHPELACPPEIGPGRVCAGLASMTATLQGLDDRSRIRDGDAGAPATISQATAEYIRRVVGGLYDEYLARRHKSRWCDKSLDNAVFAQLIGQVFPEARFLALYRHCMDVIDSGLEASPWGLSGFGFGEHAATFPGNSVAAIGSYWLRIASAISEFEALNPERCLRVRYEDLVTRPEEIANHIFAFLGEEPVPGIGELCLRTEHESLGASDQKIWFTNRILTTSVGRGERVPLAAFPPPMREAIDKLLLELSYPPVGQNRELAAEPSQTRPSVASSPALALLAARLANCERATRLEVLERWPMLMDSAIAVGVGETWNDAWYLDWSFDPDWDPSQQAALAEGSCGLRVLANAATWRTLLAGEANIGIELVSSRVRVEPCDERTLLREPAVLALCVLLGLSHLRSVPPQEVATITSDVTDGIATHLPGNRNGQGTALVTRDSITAPNRRRLRRWAQATSMDGGKS